MFFNQIVDCIGFAKVMKILDISKDSYIYMRILPSIKE